MEIPQTMSLYEHQFPENFVHFYRSNVTVFGTWVASSVDHQFSRFKHDRRWGLRMTSPILCLSIFTFHRSISSCSAASCKFVRSMASREG